MSFIFMVSTFPIAFLTHKSLSLISINSLTLSMRLKAYVAVKLCAKVTSLMNSELQKDHQIQFMDHGKKEKIRYIHA